MGRHWAGRVVKFAVLAILFSVVFSFVVMWLWNWLMPAVFGLRTVTIWQAVGLLLLCKILFGGFRGAHSHGGFSRRRIIERWERMTPEEREKFRASFAGRCGPWGGPEPQPKA